MKPDTKDSDGRRLRGCNVSSTFNFAVGGISIAAALLIGYLVRLGHSLPLSWVELTIYWSRC
jgi:hypothetical protein